MITNQRERAVEEQIEKFLEAKGKYFSIIETELFGPSIDQIIGLSTAEDDALKAILDFLETPTNSQETYLLIAKFISTTMSLISQTNRSRAETGRSRIKFRNTWGDAKPPALCVAVPSLWQCNL